MAWIVVVSNSGTALSSSETRSMISVQPRIMACAPCAISRAIGNANNQTFLAFEELGFHHREHCGVLFLFSYQSLRHSAAAEGSKIAFYNPKAASIRSCLQIDKKGRRARLCHLLNLLCPGLA
jgi:hypothetical protein